MINVRVEGTTLTRLLDANERGLFPRGEIDQRLTHGGVVHFRGILLRRRDTFRKGDDMRALATALVLSSASLVYSGPCLAQTSPDHYRKVDEIMGIAQENGCASAVAILRARYAISVANAQCQPEILKTSLPAKQLLTFSLEGRPYSIYVPVNAARRRGEARTPDTVTK